MQAIPTVYAGVRFRSRLEARWAAFFDLCAWPWTYEPMDLDGYIPDFVLRFEPGPLLVEVKPIMTDQDPALQTAGEKIAGSGWQNEALIVGVDLMPYRYIVDGVHVGWLSEGAKMGWPWGPAVIGVCGKSHPAHVGLCHAEQSYHCRVCGQHDGTQVVDEDGVVRARMAQARNTVQWRG